MRALVTGADGFVGRHLAEHLRAAGDEVVTTDRAIGGVDITDGSAVLALLGDAQPDAVYHLAGWSDVGGSWDHPEDVLVANILGTHTVLDACVRTNVARVLVVTSADVYGHVDAADQPITEQHPLQPESPYAASKAAAEMVAIQAHLGRGLGVIRARAFNHVGPGQRADFVLPALAQRVVDAVASGATEVEVGASTPRRDFTDVRDVVRAYRLLVTRGQAGEAYNVCSGHDISIAEVVDRLIATTGVPLRPVTVDHLLRPSDVELRRGDPSKLNAATGWTPIIPFDDTLADIVAERSPANSTRHGG